MRYALEGTIGGLDRVELAGMVLYRHGVSKIVEWWDASDHLAMLDQLDVAVPT